VAGRCRSGSSARRCGGVDQVEAVTRLRCWPASGLQRRAPGAAVRRQGRQARPVGVIRRQVAGWCRPAVVPGGAGGVDQVGAVTRVAVLAGQRAATVGTRCSSSPAGGRPGRPGRSGDRWPVGVDLAAVPGGAGGVDQVGAVTRVAMLAGRQAAAACTRGSSSPASGRHARPGRSVDGWPAGAGLAAVPGGGSASTRPKRARGWRCWPASGLQRRAPGAAARRQGRQTRPAG
jgi:hypothetical protein